MVGHQVHGDLDVPGVCRADQTVQSVETAEQWIDITRVGDVVAMVGHRRDHDRVEPQGVDAECREVIEPGAHPVEITDPVAVAVGERAGIDLVENRVRPPPAHVRTPN